MPISFSALTLIGALTLSLFLGILNFWFWRIQRGDRTPLWMAVWLGASAAFTFCRLLQYAALSRLMYILVPRILLSVAYHLAWLAYELGNSFIDYRPPRRERALIILLVFVPVVLLWTGNLILTDQIVIRTVAFGGKFTGVQTGSLYLPVSILSLIIGVVPVVRLVRTSNSHIRENRFMAAGFSFIILFSLSDFIATALGLAWIRFTDFSYLPVAILFCYIQIQRFGRLYRDMDVLVRERTTELSQTNEALRAGITERRRIEAKILDRARMMTALYETTSDLIIEHDLSKLLHTIVERATRLLNASGGGLYLCEPEEDRVRCVVSYNTPQDYTNTVLKYGEGSAGRVAQTGEALIINDYSVWEGRATIYDETKPFSAVLSVPVKWQGEIIGVLHALEFTRKRQYTQDDLQLITSFANQAAMAVQNVRLYSQAQLELAERERVQAALLDSRAQLSGIIETAMDGIITVDEDQHILLFNAASEKIFRCSAEEALGQPLDRFIPARFREIHREHIRRFGEMGQTKRAMGVQINLSGLRADGEEFPIEASISRIEINGQKLYTVIHRDITERKQAEETLKTSEERYRLLFESNPHPMWVYDLETLTFLVVNDAAVEHYGYSQEEFLRATIKDIRPLEELPALVENLARERRTVEWSGPWKHRKKDGTIIFVEILSHELIFNERQARLVLANDVTERYHAEKALLESEEKFSILFDKSAFAVSLSMLPDGVISDVNEAFEEAFGYTKQEAIGKTSLELGINPNEEGRANILVALQEHSAAHNQEMELHTKSGGVRSFAVNVDIVSIGGQKYILNAAQDITKRKQAEESLRASEYKFSTAFRTSPDSININRISDGLYLEVNEGFTALTGYTAEEVKGKTSLEIDIWADPADRDRLVQGLREHGEVTNLEAAFRLKDGSIRMGLMSARVILIEGDTCILSITRDITELKRAEEESRRRANEMAALAEVSRDISSTLELEIVLERIAAYAKDLLRAETSAVYLYQPVEATLQAIASIGLDAKEIRRESLKIKEGILGNIARSKVGEIVNNNASDPRAITIKGTKDTSDEHLMGVPVLVEDRLTGLIAVWRSGIGNKFVPSELDFLGSLAQQVAVAIENARLFENTRRRLSEIEAVHTVSTALRSAQSLDEAMPIILDRLIDMMDAGSALVDLLDHSSEEIVTELAHGIWAPVTGMRTPADVGVSGHVISTGQPYVTADLIADGFVVRPDLVGGLNAVACVPVMAQHQPIGTLWIGRSLPFLDDEVSLLAAIGEMVGNAIHRMRLHEQTENLLDDLQVANIELTQAYDTTLEGWAKALELRDKETEGHSRRVTKVTLDLARHMGISEPELTHVHRGILLHDIGKMGVPDHILKKTGPLGDEEWVEMRKHPQYAYDLIYPITFLRPALDIPFCHHERWDGSGYPRGLKGDRIPLAARIFAVVDVWDALINDRPYRKAWTEERTLEYIKEQSEILFDPQVVDEFLEMIDHGLG